MKTEAKVTIIVDDINTILKKRGLQFKGKVQNKIDNEVIRYMSAYCPKDQGDLIDSAVLMTEIGSGIIRQGGGTAPYGRHWYYAEAKHFTGAPIRGSHWFERSMKNGGRMSILKSAQNEAGAK